MAWAGAMGPISLTQIVEHYIGCIMFFEFSGGGLTGFGPASSPPSGPPWGIKGVLLLYLKANTSLFHAQDLTRPGPRARRIAGGFTQVL